MSVSAAAVKLLTSAATSKNKSNLLTVVLIPVVLLVMVSMTFQYVFVSNEENDIWNVAIRELKAEEHLDGTVKANTMKTLHYYYYGDLEIEDKEWIKGFIWCYFVNQEKKRFMDNGEIMVQVRRYFWISKEEKQLLIQYMDTTPPENHGGRYPYPMAGKITRTFTEPSRRGVQIEGKPHDNVIAIADGQVVQVNDSGDRGNYIVIRHNDGQKVWYSFVGNLCYLLAQVGDPVTQGQIIAFQGVEEMGGLTDSSALQFQIWLDPSGNQKADPLDYVGRK